MGIIGYMKKASLAAGIMLLALAAACGGDDGGGGSNSDNLMPTRANVVGTVAAGEALDAVDLELGQFLEMMTSASQEEDDGLEELFAIDQFRPGGLFGEVSRADIFADISDGGDDVEYFGLLLTGSFDETSLVAELESLSGSDLVATVYKGNNVYSRRMRTRRRCGF